MSVNSEKYRLLPAYESLKQQHKPNRGILDIRDFFLISPTSLGNKDAEHYKTLSQAFPPRSDNVKLRWIVLENNSPETLKYLASELSPMSSLSPSDSLETSFFTRSYLRFGLFRYSQAYAESLCEKINPETGYSASGSAKLDPQLAIHLPYFKWNPTSHTFAEMYPSLRDYAQPSVLHKQLENETEKLGAQGAFPIVVHQLWLFVTTSSTVVSFHPKSSAQADSQLDVDLDAVFLMDILGVMSKDAKDGDPLEDAYVLAAYFVRKACLLQIFGPLVKTPMIPFLEQRVALLSGKRIDAYTSFSTSIAKGEGSHQHGSKGRHIEIELLLEIITNIEELESFLFVLENQTKVISQMQSAYNEIEKEHSISQAAHRLVARTMGDLSRITADVKRLVKNATQIQAAMVQLLDLKQKEANILEAQYARQQAEEAAIQTRQTAQQGRTLLLFTVTTIMFLPLSFFTSYFGMNVQEITGDDQNITQITFWSVCAPITVTIVTLAVLIAFNESVRKSVQRFRVWWRR